jgi:hypothetical protein
MLLREQNVTLREKDCEENEEIVKSQAQRKMKALTEAENKLHEKLDTLVQDFGACLALVPIESVNQASRLVTNGDLQQGLESSFGRVHEDLKKSLENSLTSQDLQDLKELLQKQHEAESKELLEEMSKIHDRNSTSFLEKLKQLPPPRDLFSSRISTRDSEARSPLVRPPNLVTPTQSFGQEIIEIEDDVFDEGPAVMTGRKRSINFEGLEGQVGGVGPNSSRRVRSKLSISNLASRGTRDEDLDDLPAPETPLAPVEIDARKARDQDATEKFCSEILPRLPLLWFDGTERQVACRKYLSNSIGRTNYSKFKDYIANDNLHLQCMTSFYKKGGNPGTIVPGQKCRLCQKVRGRLCMQFVTASPEDRASLGLATEQKFGLKSI